ncbi:hypothetical protein JHL18_08645 [Clostridium sp. YIM B02505]|uniref:Transcriptional regulator n=1 Tax=Clostridium yunnanense TaxID=2800325 RepID=A0ABS1EMZ3_9CLOT|nr:HTH domain-containing protein [Clostridium yunnanense]MBK1810704.1 hypothetical protein [Clostridium yunnanense]
MVSTNLHYADDILRENIQGLAKNYKIELNTLSKMLGVNYIWLKDFMDKKVHLNIHFFNRMHLGENYKSTDDSANAPNALWFSHVISMLYDGIDTISEDSRVKAIIDGLTMNYAMSYESIALYSSLSLNDVESFMTDTNSISFEKKYKLAVATLFLHYLLKKEPNYDFTKAEGND